MFRRATAALRRRRNMLPHLGPTELIIILVIIIVLFGAGRISKIAGELGQGIREFRKGLSSEEDKKAAEEKKDKES
jgi:sec-independent protein translocase protein TatA